ncbi:hypothetical protein BWQ96_09563 [Gracilariopsis chorda]|uniref:Uncharacterized protein n=1 Tax=Gracilariopsis chorda TaxID=448386 RepID=A0A2V3IHW2_9FLOR|nr:hypothetical protein BWQ96_09563 [Gracilariopsis chorda]|eukprot:PXF40730.1 hypothetical protein BWQ96_09563 [Gracilariopsis chorda]
MPAILISYTDPRSVETEAIPPFVTMRNDLPLYSSSQKYPSMLLFNSEIEFHKLGYLKRSGDGICFQFDRTSSSCFLSKHENSDPFIVVACWEYDEKLKTIPVLRYQQVEFVSMSKVRCYEQWLGGLIMYYSVQTFLICSFLTSHESATSSRIDRAVHCLRQNVSAQASNDGNNLYGWVPSPKPCSIISWLDTLVKGSHDTNIQELCYEVNPAKTGWLPVHISQVTKRWKREDDYAYKKVTLPFNGKVYFGCIKRYENQKSMSQEQSGRFLASIHPSEHIKIFVKLPMVVDVKEMKIRDTLNTWGFNGMLEDIELFVIPSSAYRAVTYGPIRNTSEDFCAHDPLTIDRITTNELTLQATENLLIGLDFHMLCEQSLTSQYPEEQLSTIVEMTKSGSP